VPQRDPRREDEGEPEPLQNRADEVQDGLDVDADRLAPEGAPQPRGRDQALTLASSDG
jgi:hypothetical protein